MCHRMITTLSIISAKKYKKRSKIHFILLVNYITISFVKYLFPQVNDFHSYENLNWVFVKKCFAEWTNSWFKNWYFLNRRKTFDKFDELSKIEYERNFHCWVENGVYVMVRRTMQVLEHIGRLARRVYDCSKKNLYRKEWNCGTKERCCLWLECLALGHACYSCIRQLNRNSD